MGMRDYRRLTVWSKAHELTMMTYQITSKFPTEEHFGLSSQMRRAAISIASNIAQGYGRQCDRDFARFLHIASGSSCEPEYQLVLAGDLGYINNNVMRQPLSTCKEVRQMLAGLLKKLAAGR
ncbi:MAG: four helix bundle protein [Candidatus Thiodiazotropha endolucinida]